jgi:cellulose 1,4-beta-cellobiosidase
VEPSELKATAGDGSASLNWADNAEADLAGYTVKRSITSGSGYREITTGLVSSDYVDTAVTNGTTYYYIVTATDASSNESAASAEAEATPSLPISAAELAPPSAVYTATEAWFSVANSVPGHSYQLETSPNLILWSEMGSSLSGHTATLHFVAPYGPDTTPKMFYRIEITR